MKKKLLIASMLLALSPSAYAGSSSGIVKSFLVSRYGKLFFAAGDTQSRPTCSPHGHWAVDLVGPDAAAGKAILASIIAAHAQGKTVHVVGKGVCDVWGDRETVEYITVE